MPAPDPNSIRRVAEKFQPHHPARFQDLIPWHDEILALRDKGASGEAMAGLLTHHGVQTSRSESRLRSSQADLPGAEVVP